MQHLNECMAELAFAPEASCTDPVGTRIAWHCRQGRHSKDHLSLMEGSGGRPALAPSSGEGRFNGKREFRFHIQPTPLIQPITATHKAVIYETVGCGC